MAIVPGDLESDNTPATPRHRSRAPLIALGIVIICAGGAHWMANTGYDDAREAFDDAREEAQTSQSRLTDATEALTRTTRAGTLITEARTDTLMDAEATEEFDVEAAHAADTAATASELAEQPIPDAVPKPFWAWDLFGETLQLNDARASADQKAADYEAANVQATEANNAIDEAGLAAVHSAAEAATEFEAAHISARNGDILDLRTFAEQVGKSTTLDAETAADYAGLEAAAAAVLASEKSELADKQGELYDARIQVEAFARELAPGVLLDFDWAPIVNDAGGGSSMGGTATWWHGDPGYATITLSDTVAAFWPADASRALIAHEVGHAITVKCADMYDASTQENIEAWATAWAISMGYTDAANGTSAYGTPPGALVEAATGCR